MIGSRRAKEFRDLVEVTVRRLLAALLGVLTLVPAPALLDFGWGREGHEVTAVIAEHSMTPATTMPLRPGLRSLRW